MAVKKKEQKSTQKSTDLVRRVTWDRIQKKKTAGPDFGVGDTIGVYVKVKEGEKERVQLFTGVVIKAQGTGINRTFTVRKIASGVGVERTFPMQSPIIDKIDLISRGKVRRSRLFYLRGLKGRSARLDSELYFGETATAGTADETAGAAAPADGAPVAEKPPKKEKAAKAAKPKA